MVIKVMPIKKNNNEWLDEWILDDDTISHIPSHPFTLMQQHKSLRALHCMNDTSPSQVKSSQVYIMDWFNSIQVYSTVQYSTWVDMTWHDMHLQSIWMNMTWRHDMNMTTDDSTRFDSQTVLSQQHGTINKTIPAIQYNTATTMGMVFRTWYEYECYCSYYTHTHTRHNWYCYSIVNNNKHTTTTLCHYLHIIIIYDVFVVVVVVIISLFIYLFIYLFIMSIKVSFLKLTFTLRYCFRLLVPEERKTKIESTTQQNKTKQTI